MTKKFITRISSLLSILIFIFLIQNPFLAIASHNYRNQAAAANDSYKLLAPIGNITTVSTDSGNFGSYLQQMINISLAVTAAISIIMLVIGGLQYVFSSISESAKKEAKERITNAIIGLLIALAAYLILYTINPDLIKLGLPGVKPLSTPSSTTVEPNSGDTGGDTTNGNLGPGGPVPPIQPGTPPPDTGGPLVGPVSGGLPGAPPNTGGTQTGNTPPTNTTPPNNSNNTQCDLSLNFINSRGACIPVRICGFQQTQNDNGDCVGGNL